MSDIVTTYDFNELLDSCYFHPERVYPNEIVKLRARMAMTALWQASEIVLSNLRSKQEDVRRMLIDEMMPEHLDRAISCEKKMHKELDIWEFAMLVLKCVIFGDAIVQLEFEMTYNKQKSKIRVR